MPLIPGKHDILTAKPSKLPEDKLKAMKVALKFAHNQIDLLLNNFVFTELKKSKSQDQIVQLAAVLQNVKRILEA